jgi:murein DD-endopeptidase MepM/ murein hydrolase activator NlpD
MKLRTGSILSVFILGTLYACAPYGIYYTVKKGDTLYSISLTYGVSLKEIVMINHLKDPSQIKEGQVIFIPGAREKKEEPVQEEKIKVTKTPQPEKEKRETISIIWPVNGTVTSEFGIRDGIPHDGIDIAAPEGTQVKAVYDGKVIYSGDELKGYGNLIIIKHEGDYATVYAHNRINYVKAGDKVKKGQVIAEVGKTGNATFPHLHFEIRWKAKPINPRLLLPEK